MDSLQIKKALQEKSANVHKIKTYAILIPLIEKNGKYEILYEIRSEKISQGGEVSFPGGKIEKDEMPYFAAIRETGEELGIRKEDVTLLGESDYYENESIRINAFVGVLKNNNWENYPYSKDEVEKLFTVPLDILLEHTPKAYFLKGKISESLNPDFPFERIKNGESYSWRGMNKEVLFYDLGENYPTIWGVTASLTYGFIKKLKKN